MLSTCSLSVVIFSVVDPHHLDADPDATYRPDADSDVLFDADSAPTFHPDAEPDPDSDPSFKKSRKPLKSARIGSYSIHVGLTSAD
jgi:hypothetical protein